MQILTRMNSIICAYIRKEIAKTFLAVFVIVFLILLSTQLLRALASVSEGRISLEFLFLMLSLTNVKSLSIILPLILFLSIVFALSRFYKDSEIIAMYSCGISPLILVRSILPFILLFVVIEAVLALLVSPWSNEQITRVIKVAESHADVDVLEPGRFNIFSYGERVIYTEAIEDKRLEHIFLQIRQQDTTSIIYADYAQIVADPNSPARYLVFRDGIRYDGEPGSDDYRQIEFVEYAVLIEKKALKPLQLDYDEMPLSQLWLIDHPAASAELQWRISLVLSLLILSLLAIPLSHTSPRKGRFAKLFPAIVVYFFYTNLLSVSQNMVKKEELPLYVGMWPVHLLFLGFFLYLLGRQMGWFQPGRVSE